MTFTPINLQMFKFLLFQSVETTAFIFSKYDGKYRRAITEECKNSVASYNKQAEQIWNNKALSFTARRRKCSVIYDHTVLIHRYSINPQNFLPVPKTVAQTLDGIFKAVYSSADKYILLGRLDEMARLVNGEYAKEVITALAKVDPKYEAHIHLCLGPSYGRGGALPLMTESFVEAMWEVCESHFYGVQLGAVSLTSVPFNEC